jgi:hypothetical protein
MSYPDAVDRFASTAKSLVEKPQIAPALAFWLADQHLHNVCRGLGLGWDAAKQIIIERHGPKSWAVIIKAERLRAKLLKMPAGGPAKPASKVDNRTDGGEPIRARGLAR